MRRALALGLLLLAVGAGDGGLSLTLPAEVPTRATLDTWERITGDVETATESVVYELYVNPEREAIYEVTHYRVTTLRTENGSSARAPESEKVLWHSNPGRERPRCYALEPGGWRKLEQGSAEYRWEMGMAMHVYGLHRRARLGR